MYVSGYDLALPTITNIFSHQESECSSWIFRSDTQDEETWFSSKHLGHGTPHQPGILNKIYLFSCIYNLRDMFILNEYPYSSLPYLTNCLTGIFVS